MCVDFSLSLKAGLVLLLCSAGQRWDPIAQEVPLAVLFKAVLCPRTAEQHCRLVEYSEPGVTLYGTAGTFKG